MDLTFIKRLLKQPSEVPQQAQDGRESCGDVSLALSLLSSGPLSAGGGARWRSGGARGPCGAPCRGIGAQRMAGRGHLCRAGAPRRGVAGAEPNACRIGSEGAWCGPTLPRSKLGVCCMRAGQHVRGRPRWAAATLPLPAHPRPAEPAGRGGQHGRGACSALQVLRVPCWCAGCLKRRLPPALAHFKPMRHPSPAQVFRAVEESPSLLHLLGGAMASVPGRSYPM